ncbi:hypothetical protein N8972_00095 [Sulfurospirillum sp.]|nr:hypothetical protein [Sulfurospirillum sp.]
MKKILFTMFIVSTIYLNADTLSHLNDKTYKCTTGKIKILDNKYTLVDNYIIFLKLQ